VRKRLIVVAFLFCFALNAHGQITVWQPGAFADAVGLRPFKEQRSFKLNVDPEANPGLPDDVGQVEWLSGTITASGIGFPYPIYEEHPETISGMEKVMAEKAAQAVALRNALAMIHGIRMSKKITVKGRLFKRGTIELEGYVRGHRYLRSSWHKIKDKHYCRALVSVPLWGVHSINAEVFDDELARSIKLMPLGQTGRGKAKGKVTVPATDHWPIEEQAILFDARGTGMEPQLFPTICAQSGKVVYCVQHVNSVLCKRGGVARYAVTELSYQELTRVSSKGGGLDIWPAVLGIRVAGAAEQTRPAKKKARVRPRLVFKLRKSRKGTIVLGKKDAAQLAKDPASKKLMQKGRVVVIVDSRMGGIEGAKPRDTRFRLALRDRP